MKKMILSIALALCVFASSGQNLADVYKKAVVNLQEDAGFGIKNKPEELFFDIDARREEGKDGKNKAIVVAPDGSIFMSHRSRHSISVFDKNGNFVKEFGKKGGRDSDFVYMPYTIGILSGKYLATSAVDGRILFFDLNGNWVKTIKLDYMPMDNAMLANNKFAILGHTSWKTKNRSFVAIKDFNTNDEKIIWEQFDGMEIKNSIQTKSPSGGINTWSLPFSHPSFTRPKLLATPDGNLAIVFPVTGEIKIYSPEGHLLKSFMVSTGERLTITQEEREDYYNKAMEQLKAMEMKALSVKGQQKEKVELMITQFRQQIDKYLDPAFYPEKLPEISQAMFDSDDNLLVFAFTKESTENKFVFYSYDNLGNKAGQSSFKSDIYNLDFSNSKFVFFEGNIIAIQTLKDENSKIPIRLVRFKLKN
jgi:hypothetical protein